MDNKKSYKARIILLWVIGILIILVVGLGLTYAFMKPQVEEQEEKSNITISACAKIQLKDSNSNSINLKNTYPMADELGLETAPYEFTITSTCDNYVGFNLYLTSLTDNEIEDNAIHFAITSINNTVLVSDVLSKTTNALTEFNTEELKELDLGIKGTHKNIYKVYSNNVPLKGKSSYKLYLWVDKTISEEATMNKSFTVGVSIKSFNREESYADNCDKSLATCEIAQKVYENNTLFYHDTNLKNGAEDLSYRFSGASDVVKNYVCLDSKATGDCESDDDLYRIIGLFKNSEDEYEMKLIKASLGTTKELGDANAKISDEDPTPSAYLSDTNYYWNRSNDTDNGNVNMWAESNLNKINLNQFFYNYITTRATYLQNHITEHIWTTGGYPSESSSENAKEIYDVELGDGKVQVGESVCYTQGNTSTIRACTEEDLEYIAHIGLFYISDYMYATIPSNWTTAANTTTIGNNNWLKLGNDEWSISRYSSTGFSARLVGYMGYTTYSYNVYDYGYGVRPSFYLTSDAKISEGEGSKTKPYRITFE